MAPELREQLQAHLGSAYTIERELGGGGMSRVFLAEEVRLERTVVVKVLPPQMAAGVSVDRFEREIRLAARLQHPHIVPLLSAGSAGDLLYYMMPHIEGESLRARLAHDHELPIGETVRILRDVAEALAYAHAHGIVHRDVKPDNILLSGKHALVTDFGVAKAVAKSTGETALTSVGVALGTPAYMAPEQAAADPHTDHRADLYAVGALAYEMLAGRPPFTGASPQAVLAAQVTQPPEPITTQRASVPPALAALVMRCLEKKAADRCQTAEELLGQLEAMATPSGGVTPTAAVPPISSGTEAAIHRAHPIRVVALFSAASVGVLTIVYWLMRALGLPDWVFLGALVLLLVGLPIMVLTGLVERRRAIAHSAGRVDSRAAVGLRRWLTWRKALVGGAAAFAALGLGTAVYMAMRLLGIGPVGTLVASGVLKEREPILLADFVNRTTDSTLGPTLTEAFRVDLAQSRTVDLIDPQQVAATLARMQRPLTMVLTPVVAQEVATRDGLKAIVTGEINPAGRGYLLAASVVAAADGKVLTAVRAAAADDAHLIPALDEVSNALRERIGESLRTIRASPPLEQVTTPSLDALRLYSEARRAGWQRGDFERSISLLKQAIALDTAFGAAYERLAAQLSNAYAAPSQIVAGMIAAFAHRDRLPPDERDRVAELYYLTVDYDLDKAEAAGRASVDYRDSDLNLILLGLVLVDKRECPAAESLFVRAISRAPWNVSPHTHLMTCQVDEGQYTAAESTFNRFAQSHPGSFFTLNLRAWMESARNRHDSAAATLEDLRRASGASPVWQQLTANQLANLDEMHGKLGRAEQHLRDFMAATEARHLPGSYLTGAARVAELNVRYRRRPAAALQELQAALTRYPLGAMPAADRPYSPLALGYAHAGRVDEAERLLGEYQRVVPEGLRRGDPLRHAAEAAVASATHHPREALAATRAWTAEEPESYVCATCGVFEHAQAFEQAGEPDSALATYAQLVAAQGFGGTQENSYAFAAACLRLGELYEQRRDRAKALECYGRFVDLWKNADPELQPMVRDVRARIARLVGEH
jgi:eukaryotic-like serine/threonine-protein kinase